MFPYFKIKVWGDFPGGPVVKTLHFHFRRHGFDPWSGKFCLQSKKKFKVTGFREHQQGPAIFIKERN